MKSTLERPDTHRVLLRLSGDISTKAYGTLERFSRRLGRNVEDALDSAGVVYRLDRGRFRFFLEVDTPAALDVLLRVFGLQSLSLVDRRSWESLEDLVAQAEAHFRERVRGKRFAVRVRRSGETDRIPFRSPEVASALGRALLPGAAGVDLSHPEVTAHVDIRPDTVDFFDEKLPGRGGLPVGIEGRALALVSGGYDSAVAAWLMLKRGVELDYLFCNLGGRAHREGVERVAKVLSDQWSYGTRPRLFEIDFAPVVAAIQERTAPRYWQILLKRMMLRAAEGVAREEGAMALVTGEAIGQVSSQTLPNLAVISRGCEIAVLRPLLGFNKEEIIALSREIGTAAFSAGVEEYCAILPKHPATHAEFEAVAVEEAKLGVPALIGSLPARSPVDLRAYTPERAHPELEVETLPEGAVVIDLRSRIAYEAWHAPGALYLDFFEALKTYREFPRNRTYALYCEVGQKSAHLAELLAAEGIRAVHVRDGVRRLLAASAEADLLIP